jgi:hypothetical protein
VQAPDTEEEWQTISDDFRTLWNFPHCLGAIDGKHIALKAPNNCGSLFYNYKGFHSMVLLAVVDAHYRFLLVDVGVNGRNGDAGVFATSPIAAAVEKDIPSPTPLPDWDSTVLPHVLVGDEAFPLKVNLMKPFPSRGLTLEERVFNFRLSHARRVSENAFGILINRFAVLATRMSLQPAVAESVVLACLALHNFLRTERDVKYMQKTKRRIECEWHGDVISQAGNRNAVNARSVRNNFKDYFTTDGAVDWQWDRC